MMFLKLLISVYEVHLKMFIQMINIKMVMCIPCIDSHLSYETPTQPLGPSQLSAHLSLPPKALPFMYHRRRQNGYPIHLNHHHRTSLPPESVNLIISTTTNRLSLPSLNNQYLSTFIVI